MYSWTFSVVCAFCPVSLGHVPIFVAQFLVQSSFFSNKVCDINIYFMNKALYLPPNALPNLHKPFSHNGKPTQNSRLKKARHTRRAFSEETRMLKAPLPESKHAGVGDTVANRWGFCGGDSGSFLGSYGCRGFLLLPELR